MKHLTKLFKLLEITRSMPQHGYAVSGVQKHELSDIAQHQYLVAFMSWQLARNLVKAGARINIERVMELALIHDLGELFGSDINIFYGWKNKKAKKFAKQFEAENLKYIAKYFGKDRNYFKVLIAEYENRRSTESLTVSVADLIEGNHFKLYIGKFSKYDHTIVVEGMKKRIRKIKDQIAKKEFLEFISQWTKDLPKGDTVDLIKGA